MSRTLPVAAIENGTVIDHITSDQTWRIIQMLRLLPKRHKVTVGFNLPSKRMQFKDLIKIENHELTEQEANEITVFAPDATISNIQNFQVVTKVITSLPSQIKGIFLCPNQACITRDETIQSCFSVREEGKQVTLVCQYCERAFDRNQVGVVI